MQLFDGPCLSGLAVTAEIGWRKSGKHFVIGRVAGHELSLKMGGKFGNNKLVPRSHGLNLIAVRLAFGCSLQIEQSRVPGGNLDRHVTETCGPGADRIESVERRGVRSELREKNPWSQNCFHRQAPISSWSWPFIGSISQGVVLASGWKVYRAPNRTRQQPRRSSPVRNLLNLEGSSETAYLR